ncbi:MAG: DUF3750 domain-containing protein [Pseudomonadota bacterium]|nr:DUF3750 domain-containing protein [Pseudomonadota bacterium]
MKWLKYIPILLAALLIGPLSMAAGGNLNRDWRTASRDSAGLAPRPADTPEAVAQIYAARAFGWRGALAVHTWIAVKPANAASYTTYEVIGWYTMGGGSALYVQNGAPDRRWFGSTPEMLVDLRGEKAERAIAGVKAAVVRYPYKSEYRTWPGPNSNTFTAYVARNVPEFGVDLPPTAIGKDYIAGGTPFALSPSTTGIQLSLFGLAGVIVAVEEGLEINLLGLNFGIDPGDLALRLPGIGKIGF